MGSDELYEVQLPALFTSFLRETQSIYVAQSFKDISAREILDFAFRFHTRKLKRIASDVKLSSKFSPIAFPLQDPYLSRKLRFITAVDVCVRA